MLDPYIKKDDVLRLVNEMLSIQGLVNRADLQRGIIELQQYKRPQVRIGFKVNNANDILRNIEKYLKGKPCKEICNERRKRVHIPDNEYFAFVDVGTGGKIEEWAIVESGKELAAILGVTEQTVTKWKREDIIRRHELYYTCGTIRDMYRLKFGYYYNLSEIKETIMCLK